MRTAFAVARSSSVATQVEVQEPTKRESMRILSVTLTLIIVGLLAAPIASPKGQPAPGPTAENALAGEQEIARAMANNDPEGITRLLADDRAVIATCGGVGEGKSIFPEGIKSGFLKHTAYEVSEPRVRLYGNVVLVTTKLHNAGTFGSPSKPYDVMERQTRVWIWKDGGLEMRSNPRGVGRRGKRSEGTFPLTCDS
jgi:ketosteroid isomerase-like protein